MVEGNLHDTTFFGAIQKRRQTERQKALPRARVELDM